MFREISETSFIVFTANFLWKTSSERRIDCMLQLETKILLLEKLGI